MKTAVIYARYSSDSQTEQSIEGQLRVCEEYAAKNDIVILERYIDRAMTGTNDNRAAFQKMLKDSNARSWSIVLVYKLDRFARNQYEAVINRKKLENNGVSIVSAMENIPDTPEGNFFRIVIEGYNEYYSEDVRQKVKRGLNESRHKGNFTGGTLIYGYKVENLKILVDEQQAEVVRYIFEEYAKGIYVKDIIAALTAKGIYNRRGKPFTYNVVYEMLKNEKYIGIYKHENEIFTNMYPRIVPQAIWDKVSAKTVKSKYGKHSIEFAYLLRDKLVCGYCGQTISGETGTAKSGKVMRYYKCFGRKKHNGCNKKAVRKDFLEEFVLDTILETLGSKEYIDRIVNGLMKAQEQKLRENSFIGILEKEKAQTEKALENIVRAIENGITSNTTNKRLHELESKLDDIERKLVVEKHKDAPKLSEKQMRDFYNSALKFEPKLLINYFVKEIRLYDDSMEIIYNTPIQTSPDESRGFCIYMGTKYMRYEIKNQPIQRQQMYVSVYV